MDKNTLFFIACTAFPVLLFIACQWDEKRRVLPSEQEYDPYEESLRTHE